MPALPVILLIGHDEALTYLIERYAERAGYEIHIPPIAPPPANDGNGRAAVVLFLSIENLEAAPAQIAAVSRSEIPWLVCSSLNDQTRARELGADYCLIHPLNYDAFLTALTAVHASQRD